MRVKTARQPGESLQSFAQRRLRLRALARAAINATLVGAFVLSGAGRLTAQASAHAVPVSKAQPHRPVQPRHRIKAKPSPAVPAAQQPVAPAAPAAPPTPDWPIKKEAVPATIVWDSQGLRIDADNSSLQQILKDVSTDTGTKVEGLNSDERIFGSYGPGTARDVLADLLDGAGYNFLMIGDQGAGTPREIVLSVAPKGPAPVNGSRSPNNEADLEAEQEVREQEREQEMQLQQQQQQQAEPPNMRSPDQPPSRPGFPQRVPNQQMIQQMQQMQQQRPDQNQEQNNQQ